jgi:CRISPR/Cas system-associated exonuclease Cas4 (RecB family)
MFHDLGEVSKTAFEDYTKNPEKNPVGDWHCNYCSYKHHCWK